MEMYAAYYPPGYDFPISTLFWGAVIFVAVVAAWILIGHAIKGQRNRRSDGRAVDEGHRADPRFVHTLADIWHQTDEFPLTDQTRKQRKAIKECRTAREKASKHQNQSYPEDPRAPSEPFAPSWACYADEGSALAGMNEREQEEFFLVFGTRKHRNAIKERRKANEEAQKRSQTS